MCFLCLIFRVLVHGQIVMALSAVCYVCVAGIYLHRAPILWLWASAAFFGTLGLYLLDSVRSSEREDAISQPVRASWFRRYRALATIASLASCTAALVCVVLARPAWGGWCTLFVLASLGASYLFPCIPWRRSWVTLKSFSYAKPVSISLAWLVGALLVGLESGASPSSQHVTEHSLLFVLSTLPLLLLDSIWLDRRDQVADITYGHPTISSGMSARWFQSLRVALWCLPLLVLALMPELWLPLLGLQVGSLCLVLIEPDRIASELAQVMAASTWRFSGLAAALIWIG